MRCRGCWCGTARARSAGGAAGAAELTRDCQAFRGTLGAKVVICRPADPEAKGLVERAHDYLERSFLPGRGFASPADFNAQLQAWLELVNQRPRRALGCAPTDRIAADKAAMLALPPVAPATGWRASTRLARDHYIRLDGNDYSVHPAVIGRRVEVVADLAPGAGALRRPAGGRPRTAVGQAPDRLRPGPCRGGETVAAQALGRGRARLPQPDVEVRCLADYDTALGLTDEGGGVMAAAKTTTARGISAPRWRS